MKAAIEEELQEYKVMTMQIMTHNTRSGVAVKMDAAEVKQFVDEHKLSLYTHAAYTKLLWNSAMVENAKHVEKELRKAGACGAIGVVLHLPTRAHNYDQIVNGLLELNKHISAAEKKSLPYLLLEHVADSPMLAGDIKDGIRDDVTVVDSEEEDAKEILSATEKRKRKKLYSMYGDNSVRFIAPTSLNKLTKKLKKHNFNFRWGYCLDTAHIYVSAGNSLSNVGSREYISAFDAQTLKKIKLIHLNGSISRIASGDDRHAFPFASDDNIWQGNESGIKHWINLGLDIIIEHKDCSADEIKTGLRKIASIVR
jgi:endonuclease IV